MSAIQPSPETETMDADAIVRRYQRAKDRRDPWLDHWRDCYAFALPQRENAIIGARPGEKKGTQLYDATATDAVDQLAASLLGELTPSWSKWFAFKSGHAAPKQDRAQMAEILDAASHVLQGHFDRSNFAVEMHQCYLDLVTAGTACLMFEEAAIGDRSAFRFTAVPLGTVVFEESLSGALDVTFRRAELTRRQFMDRFADVSLDDAQDAPMGGTDITAEDRDARVYPVIEAVFPSRRGYDYIAVRETDIDGGGARIIRTGTFHASPFINFRWVKAPGEVYGRSPVMKALPDIKTANKVVELVLKNASIAVTGIWQADDDGVLNPATIRLEPGTIIPKAVGSEGLTPLRPANDMDLSTIVLDQMRERIRHALLADLLGQPDAKTMTATEVSQRAMDKARLLGATYGRLQAELLCPLALRATAILQRRGEIPRFEVDGRLVELDYLSPLTRHQAHREAAVIGTWLEKVTALGPQATALLDPERTARHLADVFGLPSGILRTPEEISAAIDPGADTALDLDVFETLLGDLGLAGQSPTHEQENAQDGT